MINKDNGPFSVVYSLLKIKGKANTFENIFKFLEIRSKHILFGYREFSLVLF